MLGLLDDLLVVPLGVWLVLRMVPPPLLDEYRSRARLLAERPVSRSAALAIVAIWLAAAAVLGWLLVR